MSPQISRGRHELPRASAAGTRTPPERAAAVVAPRTAQARQADRSSGLGSSPRRQRCRSMDLTPTWSTPDGKAPRARKNHYNLARNSFEEGFLLSTGRTPRTHEGLRGLAIGTDADRMQISDSVQGDLNRDSLMRRRHSSRLGRLYIPRLREDREFPPPDDHQRLGQAAALQRAGLPAAMSGCAPRSGARGGAGPSRGGLTRRRRESGGQRSPLVEVPCHLPQRRPRTLSAERPAARSGR